MDKIASFFQSATISGWDILFAVLALIAGFVFGSLARRAVLAVGSRWPNVSSALITLLARVTKYLVVLLGVGVALAFLGANLQPLIVAVILVATISALALRDVAGNFGAAIVLQSRRPIDVGDSVQILGHTGTVQDLNARAVIIHTADGRSVHIPNSSVLDNPLINLSELGGARMSIQVAVLTDEPFDSVSARLSGAVAAVDGVLDRPVQVRATHLAQDRMSCSVDFWHGAADGPVVVSAVLVAVMQAMRDAGVTATVTSAETADPVVTEPTG
jgi:small-conductance mechanosensitive channel